MKCNLINYARQAYYSGLGKIILAVHKMVFSSRVALWGVVVVYSSEMLVVVKCDSFCVVADWGEEGWCV